MNRASDIAKLRSLADLMLDYHLGQLKVASDAKSRSEAALAQLSMPKCDADDLEGATGAIAAIAYQRWADVRRAEINLTLALQTHQWLEAREAAKLAFGKAEVLGKLSGTVRR